MDKSGELIFSDILASLFRIKNLCSFTFDIGAYDAGYFFRLFILSLGFLLLGARCAPTNERLGDRQNEGPKQPGKQLKDEDQDPIDIDKLKEEQEKLDEKPIPDTLPDLEPDKEPPPPSSEGEQPAFEGYEISFWTGLKTEVKPITSYQAEKEMIQALADALNETHEDFALSAKGGAKNGVSVLIEKFQQKGLRVQQDKDTNKIWLAPAIRATKKILANGQQPELEVIEYANGTVETIKGQNAKGDLLLTRVIAQPDGKTISFHGSCRPTYVNEDLFFTGRPESGYVDEQGKLTYIDPLKIASEGDVAIVVLGNKLIVMDSISIRGYLVSQTTLNDALFTIAQAHSTELGNIFRDRRFSKQEFKSFYDFALGNDETQSPHIFRFSQNALDAFFDATFRYELTLDSTIKNKEGQTLLQVFGKGSLKLRALDPNELKEIDAEGHSLYAQAVLKGLESTSEQIWNRIDDARDISPFDNMLHTAAEGDRLPQEELNRLSEKQWKELFQVANIFLNFSLISQLRAQRLFDDNIFDDPDFIVSSNMDAAQVAIALSDFVETLRKEKVLISETDFIKMKNGREFIRRQERAFAEKLNFGSIVGSRYIAKKIKELDLKHIKVPKLYAVFDDNEQSINFEFVNDAFSSHSPHLWLVTNQAQVYVEKLKPARKFMTREEAKELLTACFALNYVFNLDGIILTENDTYIVDTDSSMFSDNTKFEDYTRYNFNSLKNVLKNSDDKEWFKNELEAEYERYKSERNWKIDKQKRQGIGKIRKEFGFTNRAKPFVIGLD